MCFSKELNKETKKVSTKTMDYQKNLKFTWKEKYALYKKKTWNVQDLKSNANL